MPFQISVEVKLTCRCEQDGFMLTTDRPHQVLEWVLSHLENKHPKEFSELMEEARRVARGQNGAGYFDTPTHDGWTGAAQSFKDAHAKWVLRTSLGMWWLA